MRRTVAVLALLAVVAAGCGDKKVAPKQALLAASTKTTDGHTSRMAFDVKIKQKTGAPLDIGGQGVFDYTNHVGTVDLKLPQFAGQNLGTIEMRILGSILYQKYPPQLSSAIGGKAWKKVDIEALAKQNGIDVNLLTQSQSSDPTQALALLKSASDDATAVGSEKVRGVTTTHYKATLDLSKAASASQLDATAKEKLGSLYNNLKAPADVWIDSDGRLRKITYSLDTTKLNPSALSDNPRITAGLQQLAGIDFTLELYQFGVPVSVTAPPADQVSDVTAEAGAAGG